MSGTFEHRVEQIAEEVYGAPHPYDKDLAARLRSELVLREESAVKAAFRAGAEYAFNMTGVNEGLTVSDEEIERVMKGKEHALETLDVIGRDTPGDEIESLRAQFAEVTRKYEESVGGFKRDLQEKLDQQRTKNKRLETKLLGTQAHAARLTDALRLITQCQEKELQALGKFMACNKLDSVAISEEAKNTYDAIASAKAALSTPINLDAVHEDRARECERLAFHVVPHETADLLRKEADAHRAKKEGK